jgi:predicted DNA-binding transcriptional regulator AlpA
MPLERNDTAFVPRFGFSMVQAAQAIGVSVNTFLSMVADHRMPRPKPIGNRKVWDVEEVQAAFKALPHDMQSDDGDENTWADVEGR